MNSSYRYDPDFTHMQVMRYVLDNATQLQTEALEKYADAQAVIRAYDSVLSKQANGENFNYYELRSALDIWYQNDVMTRRVHLSAGLRVNDGSLVAALSDADRIDKLERLCLRLITERNMAIKNAVSLTAEIISMEVGKLINKASHNDE